MTATFKDPIPLPGKLSDNNVMIVGLFKKWFFVFVFFVLIYYVFAAELILMTETGNCADAGYVYR